MGATRQAEQQQKGKQIKPNEQGNTYKGCAKPCKGK